MRNAYAIVGIAGLIVFAAAQYCTDADTHRRTNYYVNFDTHSYKPGIWGRRVYPVAVHLRWRPQREPRDCDSRRARWDEIARAYYGRHRCAESAACGWGIRPLGAFQYSRGNP